MTRRGLTLSEVLVAGAVLAVLLVPLLTLFSATAGDAGDDARRVEATNLAQEIMEQVTNLHKRLGKLMGLPYSENGPECATLDGWLDLEKYSAKFKTEQGVPLLHDLSRCAWSSRLFLTPPRPGYQRDLKIVFLESAPERKNIWVDALWQVRVRVRYTIPMAGHDVEREVLLVSNYFQKCRPSGKFRELE